MQTQSSRLWGMLIILFFSVPLSHAQMSSLEALQTDIYPDFPDAAAIILSNQGHFSVTLESTGYEARIDYSVRIQILTEAGIDKANISINYYAANSYSQIKNVSGQTLNLDENGTIQASPVNKEQIFRDKIDDDVSVIRISFPNVKVGSVIEYQYTDYRKNIRLFNWYFQKEIPVLHSSFSMATPPQLGYLKVYQGARSFQPESITDSQWQLNNLPALVDEAYVTGLDDYAAKIMLQLTEHLNISTGTVKTYTDTWENLTKEFFGAKYLGKKYNKDMDMLALAQTISQGGAEESTLIELYRYVRDHIKWNGDRSIVSTERSSTIFEAKTGNNAEVNLLLRALLHAKGIQAHPLLISTRSHGSVIKSYPLLTQFNHLICYVTLGGKNYFLDATDPLRPFDLLAFQDLNGEGWVLDPKDPRWITLPTDFPDQKQVSGVLQLTETGEISGELLLKAYGYRALKYRRHIDQHGEASFLQEYFGQYLPSGSIEDYTITGAQAPDSQFVLNLSILTNDFVQNHGEQMYLQPMLFLGQKANPFLEKERIYPIDFVHPTNDQIHLRYRLPEHWQVESIPENTVVKFPNQEIELKHFYTSDSQFLEISSEFEINHPTYKASDYKYLKNIFNSVIQHQGEPIVIRHLSTNK